MRCAKRASSCDRSKYTSKKQNESVKRLDYYTFEDEGYGCFGSPLTVWCRMHSAFFGGVRMSGECERKSKQASILKILATIKFCFWFRKTKMREQISSFIWIVVCAASFPLRCYCFSHAIFPFLPPDSFALPMFTCLRSLIKNKNWFSFSSALFFSIIC